MITRGFAVSFVCFSAQVLILLIIPVCGRDCLSVSEKLIISVSWEKVRIRQQQLDRPDFKEKPPELKGCQKK